MDWMTAVAGAGALGVGVFFMVRPERQRRLIRGNRKQIERLMPLRSAEERERYERQMVVFERVFPLFLIIVGAIILASGLAS